MVGRIRETIRALPGRLQDAAPHAQAKCSLLSRDHQEKRGGLGRKARCSSTLSTSWRWMAMRLVACRCRCEGRIRLAAGRSMSVAPCELARSVLISSAPPCDIGLRGLLSMRRDRPYQVRRSKHWVKVKDRKH